MRLNGTLFAVAIMLSSAGTAFASGLDFKLTNATGYDIRSVYVDPASSNQWTDDIMNQDILADGATADVTFSGDPDSCKWDLKVDWDGDYPPTVWQGLNLCNISEITLKYNRNTDETTAFTK